MKIRLFILIGLLCCQVVARGEEKSHSSALCELLLQKAYFEARDYYVAHTDSITDDFTKLYYGSIMDVVYNRPTVAVPKLEQLLAEYRDSLSFRDGVDLSLKLAEQYERIGDYDKAIALMDGIEAYAKQYKTVTRADSLYAAKHAAHYKMVYESRKSVPVLLAKDPDRDSVVKLYKKGKWDLTANIKCNGKKIKALFDTGSGDYAFMFEDKARKYGVKLGNPFVTKLNDGASSSARYGILPQIRIGNVVLHNLPVLVVQDLFVGVNKDTIGKKKQKQVKKSLDFFDIIIGIRTQLLLEKLTFNFDKGTMMISESQEDDSESNMLIDKMVFFDLEANGQCFYPVFDTGSSLDAVIVSSDYYEQHKEFILLDTLQYKAPFPFIYMGKLDTDSREYDYPAKLIISVGDKGLDMTDNAAIFRTKKTFLDDTSGLVGYYFINNPQYPIAVLDFVNMTYTPIERRSKDSE